MKGLLLKDFKLVKLQKNFFFMIIAVAVGLTIINNDATFMLGFLTFVMSMFTLSTISYDEFDNGNAFLFTLPVSRKSYVVEKYVFSLLLGGGSWVLAVLFAVVFSIIQGTVSVLEVVMAAVAIFMIMLMIQAAMIPFQLKFGGEKGRIAMVGAVGILFIIGFVAVKIAGGLGIDLLNVSISSLSTVNMGMAAAIAIAVDAVVLLVSMKISISIMDKKEF